MTTAIVSITCPHCGGRVDGVRTTDVEQTITCPYCRTELHVPRVGPVVIRERQVIYRPIVEEPNYDGALKPKSKQAQWLVGLLLLPLFAIMLCVNHEQAQHDVDQFEKDRVDANAARVTCETSCRGSCSNAGDKETGKWDYDEKFTQQMKDVDVEICANDCETKNDCLGLRR